MSKSNQTIKWVEKTVEMLCSEFNVTARVVVSGHIKIYFSNKEGKSCLCVLSKSSGDINCRHIEIGLIRRELRNKLGMNVRRDSFLMQLQPLLGSAR